MRLSNPLVATATTIIAIWTAVVAGPCAGQQLAVNQTAGVTQLDLHTLRAIFGMRLTEWPNGSRITVYVLDPDSRLHTSFAKQKLQLFPYQLTQAWDRLVFSGTGQAPLKVRSPTEMRQRLLQTPGAIGYLPDDMNPKDLIQPEIVE